GSLLSAARAYLDAGATSIACVATHGLLPGASLDKIRASGLLQSITVTDSHPRSRQLAATHTPYLQVDSIANLLSDYLLST
ncbi:MAG: ribose-phosphate pyrophosphokinase, partial [Candidatus Methylacidiphilales bacterium]